MPKFRQGLLIMRAWVEHGSSIPLRANVRLTNDVSKGFKKTVNVATPEAGAAVVKDWLEDVLVTDKKAQDTAKHQQLLPRVRERKHSMMIETEPSAYPFPVRSYVTTDPSPLLCARCGVPGHLHGGTAVERPGQLDGGAASDHLFEEPPEVAQEKDKLINKLDEAGKLGA